MEDSRVKMRVANFLVMPKLEPKKKREEFLVRLRKKKHADIFRAKRKWLSWNSNDENVNYLNSNSGPSSNYGDVVGYLEVLIDDLVKRSDTVDVVKTLTEINKLYKYDFKPKFSSILYRKGVIDALDACWKMSDSSIQNMVVSILTNSLFFIGSEDISKVHE